jgi:threonine/homoserine/homoserine lactone efflux protein
VGKTIVLAAMIVIIHACWLLAGTSFRRVLYDPVMSRITNIVFAVMLAGSLLLAFAH